MNKTIVLLFHFTLEIGAAEPSLPLCSGEIGGHVNGTDTGNGSAVGLVFVAHGSAGG